MYVEYTYTLHIIDYIYKAYMSNRISSGLGMGSGGIPITDNIPETTEKLGCLTDNIPVTTEIFGFPTYNIPDNLNMIKLSVLKNRLSRVYCKLETRIFRLSRVYCRLGTQVFQLSRVYCQLWVSHLNPYPYPRKFGCSCMYKVINITNRLKKSFIMIINLFLLKVIIKLS